MFDFTYFAQEAGKLLDAAGVVVILVGALLSTVAVVVTIFKTRVFTTPTGRIDTIWRAVS